MLDFLKTPAGIALFILFVVVVAVVIIEINYKYFSKIVLDFLFALLATVVCSPVLIVCAVLSRRRSEKGNILESVPYLGVGGKIVMLHAFSGIDSRLRYTARLFDILGGRLSFVGVKPLPVEDGALMDDAVMERFTARPGILSHLSVGGDSRLTYEEMFERDIRYAKKRGLFYDIWIAIMHAVLFLRGEGKSYLGESKESSYTGVLLARGEISEEEAESARAYAADAVADAEKAKQFKKNRYGGNMKS